MRSSILQIISCVLILPVSLQVHTHSRCLRRPLYRRAVGNGRLLGCYRFRYGNPLGRDHHLPVLWNLCKGAERSGQHDSAAVLTENNNNNNLPIPNIHTVLYHLCCPSFTSSMSMLRKLLRLLPGLHIVLCLLSSVTPIAITYLCAGCLQWVPTDSHQPKNA